jgi:hypothetical protein
MDDQKLLLYEKIFREDRLDAAWTKQSRERGQEMNEQK